MQDGKSEIIEVGGEIQEYFICDYCKRKVFHKSTVIDTGAVFYNIHNCEEMNREIFINIYRQLKNEGKLVAPRGQKTLEIQNFHCNLPPLVRFTNFEGRRFNLNYIKREFLWYLKGDRFDTSIAQYAKMWKQCINDDGSINSNYGHYIFGKINQFDSVIRTLMNDVDSRRASMVILQPYHLVETHHKEIPCTYALNFRIRDNVLYMTVHMRSQDAFFGFGNDIPFFSFIHEMIYNTLIPKYKNLQMGTYHHFVDSFHVYERHFNLLNKIANGEAKYELINCPQILSYKEVEFLRRLDFSNIPEEYKFSKWVTTFTR